MFFSEEAEALNKKDVKIIIALGHSGYEVDQRIARDCPLVDVVVGGHSNTFLWNGGQPDVEEIDGPYPTVITQESGKQVPVVQAYAYTKYMGELKLSVSISKHFFLIFLIFGLFFFHFSFILRFFIYFDLYTLIELDLDFIRRFILSFINKKVSKIEINVKESNDLLRD